jgi:hypothetical protein
MAPVRLESLVRVAVIELLLSQIKLPFKVCILAVKIAVPPFAPLVPQMPAAAWTNIPEAAVAATAVRLILPVELVT